MDMEAATIDKTLQPQRMHGMEEPRGKWVLGSEWRMAPWAPEPAAQEPACSRSPRRNLYAWSQIKKNLERAGLVEAEIDT